MHHASIESPVHGSPPGEFNAAFIWSVSLSGALGGLLFGYDWVVIGGAKPFYESFFHLTDPLTQGWTISCALVGCLAGALVSGRLTDRFGRKALLMAAAIIFCVSSLGTALASSFAVFIAWRVTGGLAIGLASSLSPMYIAEIAPAHQRGKLVALNQLTLVVGILLAQIANWKIANPVPAGATAATILMSWNGQMAWRWMFGVTAMPAALFFLGTLFLPESPRWLVQQGQRDKASRILARIGGHGYAAQVLSDMSAADPVVETRGWVELFQPRLRKVLILGCALAALQQWCGINIIFNYAEEVFSAAGYQVSDILFNIVITGVVNLVFTVVALFTIDRFGRRVLMLTGAGGLIVIYTALGTLYRMHSQGLHMLLLVVAAIACYAMSLAPVTWVVISEIFPNRVRGVAMSVSITVLWLACFVLTFTFPTLNKVLGASGTFFIYAFLCLVGFVYLFGALPETKGKSLEAIEEGLNG